MKRHKIISILFLIACIGLLSVVAFKTWNERYTSRDIASELQRMLESCVSKEYQSYIRCFRTGVTRLVRARGANSIINSLDGLFEKQSISSTPLGISCHDIAHVVGELGAHHTEDVGKTLAQCTNACGYGCQHGVLLAQVRRNPDVLNNLTKICASVSGIAFNKQDYDACLHGLGHALSDIASLDIAKSLSYCDRLDAEYDKKRCAEGVFMEIVDAPTFDHPRYVINGEVGLFCDTFAGVFRDVCFETAALHMLDAQADLSSLKAICKVVPALQRQPCVINLLNSIYYIYEGDSKKIIAYCTDLQGDLFGACILGAIQSDVVTNQMPTVSLELCRNIPVDYQHSCYLQIGEKVAYVYGNKARESVCGGLSDTEMSQCLGQ